MNPERARIQADLSGVIEGEVRCDDLFLQMYASDASIYEIKPLAVIRPTHTADVVAVVKYAGENNLPIFPRGAGSNVIGASIGAGLVMDFSYSMRRVEAVGRENVTVQPGVVLGNLNQQLRSHGRLLGPDPDTRMVTTIGGMLSLNSTGSHWVRYGSPRDAIIRLQMVLPDGEVVEFHAAGGADSTPIATSPRMESLQNRVEQLLTTHADLIEQHRPKVRLNQAGYNVFDVHVDGKLDLTRLLVGSEGTLGLITEATLKTEKLPDHRGVALLFFHQLDSAAQAAVEISELGVAACDLVDRRLLSLARENSPAYQRLIPLEAEAMLLVEFHASDNRSLQDKLERLTQRIQRRRKLAFDVKTTTQKIQRDFFWRIVRRTVPTLFKVRGNRRAIPFIEDIAIRPDRLPEFLKEVHRILNENEVTASLFAHAPQGLIHVRPFMSLSDSRDQDTMERLAKQLFDRVLEFNGTISGTHGDGLSRSWYLNRQYGRLYGVFNQIKTVFDPHSLLNRGKIVASKFGLTENIREVELAPELLPINDETLTNDNQETRPAKKDESPGSLTILQPNLNWSPTEMAFAARDCNGCGRCRTQSPLERMCPLFRLSPREEASPRAKANLMRGVLTGAIPLEALSTDPFKEIVDLCVNCHQCRLECPANVDIPKLMIEAKSQYYQVNGLKISEWLLTRLDWLYGLAGQVPILTNFLLKNSFSRWTIDRLFGIAQGRKLPEFESQTFLRWATRQKLNRPVRQPGPKVVFFVDAYVNWNDVELGKSLIRILKHNGIEVLVPSSQNLSGMSMISAGALTRAKKLASLNVESLSEWVRQGYQIVTTEPSAALALKHEYLNLLDDPDATLVAENTTDASNYLLALHRSGNLELDFKPLNASIGYHLPCHQRALGTDIPAMELLRLIPGLKTEFLDKGCSGMAGTFGLMRKNYVRSLRMGFSLINAVRNPDIMVGTTECSTCKIQMEQGTSKPTVHPLKILALAYGLMPELEDLFHRRSGERVVS